MPTAVSAPSQAIDPHLRINCRERVRAAGTVKRTRVAGAAATVIQDGTPVNYRAGRLVPWRITGIEM